VDSHPSPATTHRLGLFIHPLLPPQIFQQGVATLFKDSGLLAQDSDWTDAAQPSKKIIFSDALATKLDDRRQCRLLCPLSTIYSVVAGISDPAVSFYLHRYVATRTWEAAHL
jgi:hypothetical protein